MRDSWFKTDLFHAAKHDPKRPKFKGPFSMDYKERGSHARAVYLTPDTSRMGTVVVVVIQALYRSITTRRKYKGTNI